MKRALPLLVGLFASASAAVFAATPYMSDAENAARAGDSVGAVQMFHSAIIADPRDPAPYAALGDFYARAKEPDLARKYWTLALSVEPGYAPALRGLALLDIELGDRANALVTRDILRRACGENCPETAQVEKALSENAVGADTNKRAN